ncbi:GDSL esterase/lipase At2g03980-like [Durio zibethinus]|uniref:GDSL esterase/lipase At2g03980-like n=1 Tax=Durio zibethinus TaxID=66656 RepID=A0A6P5YAN2_DURZI|nr:GDSL esterase/lipase At2g03980-like [Durio zibethinus]
MYPIILWSKISCLPVSAIRNICKPPTNTAYIVRTSNSTKEKIIKIVNCIFIFFLLLQYQFFSLGSADVVTVPPFIISKKSILKYLSLENINFDVPALYVFGDSYVDAGNNNYVHVPQIERNYTPYGIDFGGKPTGRYTNGRTVADFIAQIVGLPFPPPVLSLSKGDKRIPQTGINYACGSLASLKILENCLTNAKLEEQCCYDLDIDGMGLRYFYD